MKYSCAFIIFFALVSFASTALAQIQLSLHVRSDVSFSVKDSVRHGSEVAQGTGVDTASILSGDPLFVLVSIQNTGNESVTIHPIHHLGGFRLRLTTPSGRVIHPVPADRQDACVLMKGAELGSDQSIRVETFVYEYSHADLRKPTEMRYCFSELGSYTLEVEYDPEPPVGELVGVAPGLLVSNPVSITVNPVPTGEADLPEFETIRLSLWDWLSDQAGEIAAVDMQTSGLASTRPWLQSLRLMLIATRQAHEQQQSED